MRFFGADIRSINKTRDADGFTNEKKRGRRSEVKVHQYN